MKTTGIIINDMTTNALARGNKLEMLAVWLVIEMAIHNSLISAMLLEKYERLTKESA